MAPIKFEENIKDKLEQRRLEPSQDAWDVLSNRLDNNSKKRNKGLFLYLGIAASIVGVLLMYTLLIKSSNEADAIQEVVEKNTELKNDITPDPKVNAIETQVVETTQDELVPVENVQEELNKQKRIQNATTERVVSNTEQPKADVNPLPNKNILNQSINTTPKSTVVAATATEKQNRLIEEPLNALDYESAKVIEVVAQIKELEAQGNEVTDNEIDALLKQAERDILKQRLYNETTRTVDADALLKDVEEDLEQSFRARVFQNLKSNFNSVKTAVAARNN